MPEVPFALYLAFLILFTLIDKGLTLASLSQIQKNFPNTNAISAEKNPIAKYSFQKLGLWGGTITMFIFSIGWMIAFWLLGTIIFGSNRQSIFLYTLFILYGFTIANNIYFLLKYSQVIA